MPDRQGRGEFGRSKTISVRTTCIKDGGRRGHTYSVQCIRYSGGLIGSEVENEKSMKILVYSIK